MRVALAAAGAIVVAVSVSGSACSPCRSISTPSWTSTLRERAAQIAQLNATAPALLVNGLLDVQAGPLHLINIKVVDAHPAAGGGPGGFGLQGRTGPQSGRWPRRSRADARPCGAGAEPVRLYVAPPLAARRGAGGGAVLVASFEARIDRPAADACGTLILLGALGAAAIGALAPRLRQGRGLAPLRRRGDRRGIERTRDPGAGCPPRAAGGRRARPGR